MVFGLFKKKEPVKVTVKSTGETFMCNPDEMLMKAALRAKIDWPLSCKVGSCGSCRATILEGEGHHPSGICDVPSLLKKEIQRRSNTFPENQENVKNMSRKQVLKRYSF